MRNADRTVFTHCFFIKTSGNLVNDSEMVLCFTLSPSSYLKIF